MSAESDFATAVKGLARAASTTSPQLQWGQITSGWFGQTGQYVDVSLAGVAGSVRIERSKWATSFAADVDLARSRVAAASGTTTAMNGRIVVVVLDPPGILCAMAD